MDEKQLHKLEGTVDRIVFRNEDNGWTVLDLECEEELHKVVGIMPDVNVGEYLTMSGEWVEHQQFGHQFRAETVTGSLPVDTANILRYLASGAVKGVGVSTASRIVDRFGEDTLRVLEEEPNRLAEIRGISPSKAAAIGENFAMQHGPRELMLAFSQFGLSPSEAMRCWKRFGNTSIERIKSNPYILCSSGLYIPFERADRLNAMMERPQDDPHRIEAGILYVLRHNLGNGHTCLPVDKLVPTAMTLLGVPQQVIAELLNEMIEHRTVRRECIKERDFIFLPHLYRAEKYAASRLKLMMDFPPQPSTVLQERLNSIEKSHNIHYAALQRTAIEQAVEKGILILTGGPGTGKTTTLKAIITILEGMGETVAIAAPTGRAAKRISELTGSEAKTIHRLLEVQWDDNDSPAFSRDEKNPLDADAVVVDELSMVDSLLFDSLLRAMKIGCRLIMVGDTDQLPAVGAGCVLHDLIDSGTLPVVQLNEVFRQAQQSQIVINAHRIVQGHDPDLTQKNGDFFFLPQNSGDAVVQTVMDLCNRRLPGSYGYTVFNGLQVLCPGKKGEIGTWEINRKLQELLNPPAADKQEMHIEGNTLRVGDKVMHTKNNYDIVWNRDDGEGGSGVFNGDIGLLEKIDISSENLTVRYEDRVALYSKQDAQDLELAYAVTVHKSQGSEFDAVVIPVFRNQSQLCYRNLLYTAVTRAKRLLILVGSSHTIHMMVQNNKKTLRYSGLRYFLSKAAEVDLSLSEEKS